MKNKKLLSFLCLVALTGCQSGTSTSTNSQPSSPTQSSTVTPSSPVSSSTEEVSSTGNSSTSNSSTENSSSSTVDSSSSTGNSSSSTVDSSSSTGNSSSSTGEDSSSTNPAPVEPTFDEKLEAYKEKVLAAIDGTLTNAELRQTTTGNNTVTTTTHEFYNNSVVETVVARGGYGNTDTKTYKTIVDDRYYEVVEDNVNSTTTVKGFDVVDVAENRYTQVSKETAKSNVSTYATFSYEESFGRANSLENIVSFIFNNYDSSNCYNAFLTELNDYTTRIYYVQEGWSVYSYEVTFTINSDGELATIEMIQTTYPYSGYDKETHSLLASYPSSRGYFDYYFEYGELVDEETPCFDIEEIACSNFEIEVYTDYEFTNKVDPATHVFNAGEYAYIKFVTTPEDITGDTFVVESSSDTTVANPSSSTISFKKAGTTTVTYKSALGVSKSVTLTAKAPDPESVTIDWYSDAEVPEMMTVNDVAELPACQVNPTYAEQDYEWVVVEGTEYAETVFDETKVSYSNSGWSIKAKAAGTVKIQAVAKSKPSVGSTLFEIEILSPLSEEDLTTALLDNRWAYNDNGLIYELEVSETSISVNFGKERLGMDWSTYEPIYAEKETIFSANYEFDYELGVATLSEVNWENASADGMYATFENPQLNINKTGKVITLSFEYENYGSIDTAAYEFTPALSDEEVKEKIYGSWSGYFEGSFTFTFNEDGTGTIGLYLMNEDYDYVLTQETTFNFTYENGVITLTDLVDNEFTFTVSDWDYSTGEEIEIEYTIVFSNTIKVENLLATKITVSYTLTDGDGKVTNPSYDLHRGTIAED